MTENTTLDKIPFPIGLLDSDGTIIANNRDFARQIGLQDGTGKNTVLADYYVSEQGDTSLDDHIRACIERLETFQVGVLEKNGKKTRQTLLLTPDPESAQCSVQIISGMIVDHRDGAVSAQSKAAGAVAPSKQTIDFLSGLNHHLRTPVNGVLGIADLLAETELSEQQASYVDILSRSCNALIHLVDEIQSITLLEQGVLGLERDNVNIQALVQDALNIFSVIGEQKEITSKIDVDGSLPEALITDSKKLRQTLFILLDNAFRYTDQGTVGVTISFDARPTYPILQLSVKDTGIGIANDRLPSLFDEISGTGNVSDKNYGNTGLGLILCHKLVELMGGTIEVDSSFGHGACFTVNLPVSEARTADDEAQHAGAEDSNGSPRDPLIADVSWNILVAEDNPVNQMLFRTVLERFGHRVTVVGNGQEAVARVQMGQPFDIILMDISMPVMDGIDATAMIRSLFGAVGSTPILALTAHAMDGDREKFINAGMDGYQSKPVDPMTLQKAIAEVISNHTKGSTDSHGPDPLDAMAPEQSEHPANGLKN